MRSRAARVTLALLAIAAIGTAAYFYWTAQIRINSSIAAEATFNDSRAAITRAAFDLRSAQQAYVAAAQNEGFWFDKATACMEALRTALPAAEGATASTEARTAVTDAAAALQEFEERDRRIRGYVASGQKLLAADIIFSDGLDLVSRVLDALDRAASADGRDARSVRHEAIRQQIIAASGAAAAAILVLLVLTPLRVQQAAATADRGMDPAPAHKPLLELDLRAAPKPVAPPVSARPATATRQPSSAPPKSPIELDALARVCTDLARLSDASSIPAILERTAAALDASGIVLWIADAERRQLTPVASHGYAPSVLSRVGPLSVDAENATAAAFRTGLLQTVAGAERSSGAVAAPLVAPSGCVGVMAAEMRHGGEKVAARLAAATIVAAQLGTIVAPTAAHAHADDRTAFK